MQQVYRKRARFQSTCYKCFASCPLYATIGAVQTLSGETAIYDYILYEVADGVATITLNRPDIYNAFNDGMTAETIDALKQARRDKSVRCVVLTGAGKAFCSGQDLTAVGGGEGSIGDHLRHGFNRLATQMRTLEKPVLGAINGVAAGAGSAVALACDVRILSEQASFVFAAFVNIGLVPDTGATHFLPRLVGASRAFELMVLRGADNRLSAQEALDWGLASAVVPHDDLPATTTEWAAKLAAMPTRAIGLTKRALNAAFNNDLAAQLEYEAQLQTVAGGTHDFQEGVAAFLEKRSPDFKGA